VSYTTPQLDAAEAVAALLTGRTIGGFNIVASADELLPKYELAENELDTLRVDCVPGPEWEIDLHNRGMGLEDCPVNVGVQCQCGAGDNDQYRRLLAVLRGIMKTLRFNPLEDFGYPVESITVVDFPSAVEQDGRFFGIVGVLYRAETEDAE
jgi:hypothetical protein